MVSSCRTTVIASSGVIASSREEDGLPHQKHMRTAAPRPSISNRDFLRSPLSFHFNQRSSRHAQELAELASGGPSLAFSNVAVYRSLAPPYLARQTVMFLSWEVRRHPIHICRPFHCPF